MGCLECMDETSTSCTECLPGYLHIKYDFNHYPSLECIIECPIQTFYNDVDEYCQGIILYNIYIYIDIYIYIYRL